MTEMQPLASKPQISPAAPAPIILRTEKIIKVYPGTVALDQVDFKVYRGKVNVLIGENGAGKSTLMKILSGVEEATAGKIFLEGQEASIRSPSEALQLGIGIIYQEMGLFPNLDVTENIFMARDLTRAGGLIDRSKEDAITLALMRRLEQSITPRQLVQDLRLGQQQIIEIARAYRNRCAS
jgi:erythritol transport system ATP-binding protein